MRLAATSLTLLIGLLVAACTQPAASPSPSASIFTPSPTVSPSTPSATPSAPPASPSPSTVPGVVRPTQVPLPNDVVISAPSSESVWALVGGVLLYRSTDRGTTWEQRGLPAVGLPRSISFQSGVNGWVTTVDPSGACPTSYRIWATADGGATYREIQPTGIGGNACGGAVTLVDATTAFLSGGGNETDPFLYRSSDGGLTWTALTPPSVAGAPASALSLGAVERFGTTLLMQVIDWRNTPPQRAVYRSTDNGATWSFAAAIPTGEMPASIGLATATRWFVLGDGAASAQETTDAGATWHPYTTDYQQAAPVGPALYFADANVGYATVRGTIQRTIDGGAHWTRLSTPGT